jgi:hypothetical protein
VHGYVHMRITSGELYCGAGKREHMRLYLNKHADVETKIRAGCVALVNLQQKQRDTSGQ